MAVFDLENWMNDSMTSLSDQNGSPLASSLSLHMTPCWRMFSMQLCFCTVGTVEVTVPVDTGLHTRKSSGLENKQVLQACVILLLSSLASCLMQHTLA